jgi:hypothetical protein
LSLSVRAAFNTEKPGVPQGIILLITYISMVNE